MSGYSDSQSEDGELARSPVPHLLHEPHPQDDLDFSLSDEDREAADSLDIKPPQAVIRPAHHQRSHKRSKDRHKDSSRREKKHLYRDRESKSDKMKRDLNIKPADRETDSTKEYYREKAYYREKDAFREKEYGREREVYREKEMYREKDVLVRDKEMLREKEAYREREQYRERDVYRETMQYRDAGRQKESYKDKDIQREREAFISRERMRYSDPERRREVERAEAPRSRTMTDEQVHSEKENRDRSSGDKELEDLRSRLLSKRISKELQSHEGRRHPPKRDDGRKHRDSSNSSLDKSQQERKKRLLEAEREMEKRKQSSRTELEARRQERRQRGVKRSVSPPSGDGNTKKIRVDPTPHSDDNVVTVSDTSDVEIRSDSQNSDQEEGEHSQSEEESEEESSSISGSESESKSEAEDTTESRVKERTDKHPPEQSNADRKERSKSPDRRSDPHSSPTSDRKRSRTRSRSRSHSFSPPPQDANGTDNAQQGEPDSDDEKLVTEKLKLLPPYFPALQGCRSVEEFQCLNRIEEGTYGVVYRARDKTTEEIVALKRLKMEKEKEGFPITSLREINTLLKGQHPNIVTVREIVVGSNMDKIFIVMDYVEHDLKSLMETMRGKKQVFLPGEVKCLMTQLLQAVHHLHDNWILHRDLKTSNLLLSHKGILKVGDFGLAREYGSPLRQYTPIVVTLWYRAPELLLCCKEYSTSIDMWSVGCIFAEFITMNPLFPGKSEVDQLNKIFKDLGTPSESIWPGYSQLPAVQKMTFAEHPAGGLRQRAGPDLLSEVGLSLLQGFLNFDPARRVTADAALDHPYFKEQPVAIDPAMFPTWPAKSEGGRRSTHSPRPPAGGAAYAQFARADDEALGFHIPSAPAPPPHNHRALHVAPGFSLKF